MKTASQTSLKSTNNEISSDEEGSYVSAVSSSANLLHEGANVSQEGGAGDI